MKQLPRPEIRVRCHIIRLALYSLTLLCSVARVDPTQLWCQCEEFNGVNSGCYRIWFAMTVGFEATLNQTAVC